jgi:hypothetical protein
MSDWTLNVTRPGSNNEGGDATYAYSFVDNRNPNVCSRNAGLFSGTTGTFATWWITNVNATQIDNACKMWGPNLRGFGHGNTTGNATYGYKDRVLCLVHEPNGDDMKYKCCTDNPSSNQNDVDACGVDWCKGQSKCTNFLKNTHCAKGDNMVTDELCYTDSTYKDVAKVAQICARPEMFRHKNCQNFCAGEVNASQSTYSAACLASAGNYCKQKSNFYDPECACINYEYSPDYLEYIEKFPTLKVEPSQCFAEPCAKAKEWPELYRSTSKTMQCTQQLTICNQIMNLSDIKTNSLGSISQRCDADMAKSATNITLAPGSVATSAPGSTAAPSSTAAPTVVTASKPQQATSSASSTYMRVGGAGLSFFCSILLSLLVVVLIFVSMD